MSLQINKLITKGCGQVASTPASFLCTGIWVVPGWSLSPEPGYLDWGFFIFLSCSKQILAKYLKLDHDYCLLHPFHFIYESSYHFMLYSRCDKTVACKLNVASHHLHPFSTNGLNIKICCVESMYQSTCAILSMSVNENLWKFVYWLQWSVSLPIPAL